MFIDKKMYLNIEDEHIKEKNLKKKNDIQKIKSNIYKYKIQSLKFK